MSAPIGLIRATLTAGCVCLAGTLWAASPLSHTAYDSTVPIVPVYMDYYGGGDAGDYSRNKGFPADCFCYRWQIWANALFLSRSGAGDRTLAFSPPKEGEVINADEMDFGFRWGPQIGVYYFCNNRTSIGTEFFFIDGWNASGVTTGDMSVRFPSTVHLPAPGATDGIATYDYTSRLYSTELNLRRHTSDRFALLAGFRYIELAEEMSTAFTTGGDTSSYLIDVNNRLYGFQVGAIANLRNYGWGLDAWGKAGIYANSADQDTLENYAALGGGTAAASASDDSTAFVGELGVALVRSITQRLSTRVGYQVLWLEGVALAPEQLGTTDTSIPFATVDNNGGVFYHGGFVGFEYLW